MSKSGTSPISMSISSLKLLLAKKDLPSGKLLLYIDMVLYYYIIESHSYGKSQSVSPPSSKNRETPVKLLGSATPSIGFPGSATGKLFCLTGVLWDSMVFHGVFEWAKRFSCLIFFHSVAQSFTIRKRKQPQGKKTCASNKKEKHVQMYPLVN